MEQKACEVLDILLEDIRNTDSKKRVENERLKLELEQAKKKSKGFFHWLFS